MDVTKKKKLPCNNKMRGRKNSVGKSRLKGLNIGHTQDGIERVCKRPDGKTNLGLDYNDIT